MVKLILATTSKHRIAAFSTLGIPFATEASHVDEYTDERPAEPVALVRYLSEKKARAVAANHKGGIVIGFDTVDGFEGGILEKPKSREEAKERLRTLSGKSSMTYTGIFLIDTASGRTEARVAKTAFRMRSISDAEIDRYLDQGDGYKTHAVGFNPLHYYSASFTEKVDGSYHSFLTGMPLEVVVEMLKAAGAL